MREAVVSLLPQNCRGQGIAAGFHPNRPHLPSPVYYHVKVDYSFLVTFLLCDYIYVVLSIGKIVMNSSLVIGGNYKFCMTVATFTFKKRKWVNFKCMT
jgi:hypothetical protein